MKFEESVWTQIKLNNKDMLLMGCIYKSPRSSPELNKLLTTVAKDKKFSDIMVMGDFNYSKIVEKKTAKGDKNRENFIESIRDSYLFQHVMHGKHKNERKL